MATKKKKEQICLIFRSYDHRLLDQTVKDVVSAAQRTGAKIGGPIPLPVREKCFTVNTSPHVDKKAREQFGLKTHKRLVYLVPEASTMDALFRLGDVSLGVDIEVK